MHQDQDNQGEPSSTLKSEENEPTSEEPLYGSYWLTRILFLRYLSFVYMVAFLVAYNQNKQLIGTNGLLPADSYITMIKRHFGESHVAAWANVPTLFLFVDEASIDWWLDMASLAG